jgi:hypothetical protein
MYPNRLRRTHEDVGSTSHRGQTRNTFHLGKKDGEEDGDQRGDDHRRPHPHRWLETGPKIRSQNNPSLIGRCVLYSTVSGFSTFPTTLSVESIRSAQPRICSGEAIPISMRSSLVHPVSLPWAIDGSFDSRGKRLDPRHSGAESASALPSHHLCPFLPFPLWGWGSGWGR